MAIFSRARRKERTPDVRVMGTVGAAAELLERAGYTVRGRGAVCHRGASDLPAVADEYGYRWTVVTGRGARHLSHTLVSTATTIDADGAELLCSHLVLDDPHGRPLVLVALHDRGTFYPFAPREGERRDSEVELAVRDALGEGLGVEKDLRRWAAIWGAPGL